MCSGRYLLICYRKIVLDVRRGVLLDGENLSEKMNNYNDTNSVHQQEIRNLLENKFGETHASNLLSSFNQEPTYILPCALMYSTQEQAKR
ncbi:MAG: hypothetical protein LEGION0398_MBIBDBAK_01227 [Legionellaceae bacterium]